MTAQEYLKEHGISETTAKKFNLSSDDNFLHIPVKDEDGNLLFTKSRNLNYTKEGTEPKYKNPAGSHAALFNLNAVKDEPNIVLCEGEIDCMRLIQGGIPSVSSTGGAGGFNKDWASLFTGKNVWICLDNDDAGKAGTRKVLESIPHARVISLPEGVKDICDFFLTHTKKEFVQLMRLAQTKSEWETSNLPEDYNLIPVSELINMEFEVHPWLIDNILYNEGFCFIYGAEGTGKSFIALSIAQAVASGKDWLNHFHVSSPVNVLILDKENPLSMVAKRAKGLGFNSTNSNVHYLQYPEKFQLVDSKGEYSAFAQALSAIATSKNIGLIVIDSFVDFMLGSESSAEDTQLFFNALRELFPHKAFVALHHENKPSQGVFRNDSQRLRGSSNINAQTFTSFRLEPVAKSKTEMTLKQTKARDALKLDKFMIRMQVGAQADGSTVVTGFEYVGEVEESVDEGKSNEAKELIKEMIIGKNFISQKEVIEMGTGRGISDSTLRRAIREMVEEGEINKTRKGKEVWYSMSLFTSNDAENDPSEIFNGEIL